MAPPDPAAPPADTTPPPTWWRWIVGALAALGIVAVLALGAVLAWGERGLLGLGDRATAGLQEMLDPAQRGNPGLLSIEPPQVYTRERLVNDRFREATWLSLELDRTLDAEDEARFLAASQSQSRAASTQIAMQMGGATAPTTTAQPPAVPDAAPPPDALEVFRARANYREQLRNDLMDTLLDDGHDLDGNTLYRLNFDAVTIPWADRTRDPGTAVYVVRMHDPFARPSAPPDPAEPPDAMRETTPPPPRRDLEIADDLDLLRSWQREMQVFLSGLLTMRIEGFRTQARLVNPVDPKENIAFDRFLRLQLIEEFLRLASQIAIAETCTAGSPKTDAFCALWAGHPSDPTTVALRMEDMAEWTGFQWRIAAPSPEAYSPAVTQELLNAMARAKAVNDIHVLTSPEWEQIRRDPRIEQLLAQNGVTPRQVLRDPERKRATFRVIAALRAMSTVLPLYHTDGLPPLSITDIGTPGALDPRPTGLSDYLQQYMGVQPSDAELEALGEELLAHTMAQLTPPDPTAQRRLADHQVTPVLNAHAQCKDIAGPGAGSIVDFGRCVFLRVNTASEIERVIAQFLLERLHGTLTGYARLEGMKVSVASFLDVQLSGCEFTGCRLVVEPYTDLRPYSAGMKTQVYFDQRHGTLFSHLARLRAGNAAEAPVTSVRLTGDILTQLKPFAALGDASVARCLGLADHALVTTPLANGTEVYLACMLRRWLEEQRSDLAVYGVSPREQGPLGNAAQSDGAGLGAGAQSPGGGASATLTANETRSRAVTQLDTRVIGFSQMPRRNGQVDQRDEAQFGWAIRPARALDGRHWSREHNRLSAVVSVPSWWKWVAVDVTACWVTPAGARALGERLSDEPANICEAAGSAYDTPGGAGQHALERTFLVQLPRRVDEVTDRFNFDFIKAPYFDRDWDDQVSADPSLLTLEVGRPGRLVLAGERLWRGTVVTLNTQRADAIMVLPDMKGVIAEFRCVAAPPPGAAQVPVIVWTSEGRTRARQVALTPFAQRTPSEAPCDPRSGEARTVTPDDWQSFMAAQPRPSRPGPSSQYAGAPSGPPPGQPEDSGVPAPAPATPAPTGAQAAAAVGPPPDGG